MVIKEKVKELIIEKANTFRIPKEIKAQIEEKRRYFHTEFSKEKIAQLDKDHYIFRAGE